MKEKDVMLAIRKRLEHYQYYKTIIWWSRLNSGKIQTTYGSWIKLCEPGTPDFIIILRNKKLTISVIFPEAKSDTGKLRSEQVEFRNRLKGVSDMYFLEVRDVQELDDLIRDVAFDKSQAEIDEIVWPSGCLCEEVTSVDCPIHGRK